jgi:methylated-DNA-protein-cysteine methyltransferase-like protein
MTRVDKDFKPNVLKVVSQIPEGRLMTYGQIAAICGAAWAAWEVGQIAHFADPTYPWQRVVNKQGGLAKGYPGGVNGHKLDLEREGIKVVDDKVDIEKLLWWPPQKNH